MVAAAQIKDGTDDQHALTLEDAALPVVDVAALAGDDPAARQAAAEQLGHAARTSGFFYIVGHGIPQQQIDAAVAASKAFHAKPRSYKMKYWCGFTTNHRGYVPYEENGSEFPKVINFNEAFDLSFEAPADHPDYLAGWRMTGPNVWPDLPGFQDAVSTYYNTVFSLGHRLLEGFALALDVDVEELRQFLKCPTSQLRLLRYVPNDLPKDKDRVGIGAHSDFECFTILYTGGPGLQVMNAEDYWIEAPPIPGAFVVNIGDIFEAWSGGQFKSTQHRVTNVGYERFSMPLFFGLDYDAIVQPLPKFRTEETLAKYPPFQAGHHLMQMTTTALRYIQDAVDKGVFTPEYTLIDENPFKRQAKVIDGGALKEPGCC